MSSNSDGLVHNNFLPSPPQPKSSTSTCLTTAKPTSSTEHSAIQKGTGVAVTLLPKGRLSTSEFLVLKGVVTLVFLNSSLNPFLYCWKISEVRQVVKETIRQAPSCPQSCL